MTVCWILYTYPSLHTEGHREIMRDGMRIPPSCVLWWCILALPTLLPSSSVISGTPDKPWLNQLSHQVKHSLMAPVCPWSVPRLSSCMIKVGMVLAVPGTSSAWPRWGTKNEQLSFLALVNHSPELYSPSEMLLFLNDILKKLILAWVEQYYKKVLVVTHLCYGQDGKWLMTGDNLLVTLWTVVLREALWVVLDCSRIHQHSP